MKNIAANTAIYTIKKLYSSVVMVGVIAATIISLFGALDVTGITSGQIEHLLELPESMNQLVELGVKALNKYIEG